MILSAVGWAILDISWIQGYGKRRYRCHAHIYLNFRMTGLARPTSWRGIFVEIGVETGVGIVGQLLRLGGVAVDALGWSRYVSTARSRAMAIHASGEWMATGGDGVSEVGDDSGVASAAEISLRRGPV